MAYHLFSKIVKKALKEDIGMGDITTANIFNDPEIAKGIFLSKAEGIISGLDVIEIAYHQFCGETKVTLLKKDGDTVFKNTIIAEVEGSITTLLSSERVILNLMQHTSGIATATNELVKLLNDPSISITDTRKTLPGLRGIQKYAVRCGGGKNHRFRLDDGVMIKDNHIKAAGSISKAVELVRKRAGHIVKIEIETENREQVLEAVEVGVDVIMIDNCHPEQVKEFVELVPEPILVEVSGNVDPTNIARYCGCGADIISVGWITHSVKALDISFDLVH